MSWIGVLKVFQESVLHRIIAYRSVNSITMPFYAVARGRAPGVFMSWGDCEAQVKGFSGARYKKFDSMAAAADFISAEGGGNDSSKAAPKPKKNTYGTYSKPNTSNSNLKRSFSTSSSSYQKRSGGPSASKNPPAQSSDENYESDMSDDLDTILNKQMDDIENRLKGFQKGVDKIIKKSVPKPQRKTQLIEPPQPKRRRSANRDFERDNYGFVQVYTDGACSANGCSGARAGLGVYWGDGHLLNTSAPVSGRATNNCGEIQAATHAIKQALDSGITQLSINTDSQFLINAVTKWIPGWKKKGWKLASGEPVKNEVDFKDLDSVKDKLVVKWNYVEAHRGIHGNEEADRLAKAGAEQYRNK